MKTKLKEKITLRPRGRKVDFEILKSLEKLLDVTSYRRDHLIEYLHKIQDSNGAITKDYMTALSNLMGISQTEVYEVASFYAHFKIIDDDALPQSSNDFVGPPYTQAVLYRELPA